MWGFAGCAAALLVCGAFALAHKPTPQQIIEQGDERNAAINGKAGLRAFEAFSVLAPLAALALYAFEQISTAGVLTIIAVEVVASIVYFAQIARMQRIMQRWLRIRPSCHPERSAPQRALTSMV